MASAKNHFLSIYLDTRRTKESGKYPVKLRVFTSSPRIQKLYPLDFEFSKAEFKSIWETTKPRIEFRDTRIKLQRQLTKANDIADDLKPFTFETFEKKLYRKAGDGADILYHYKETIAKLEIDDQVGTASNYQCAINSFKKYIENRDGKEPQKLLFTEITPDWLNQYENYMIKKAGKSMTTVSMYVRTLRTLFNSAISQNEILPESYPFHTKLNKTGYTIASVKKVKKALSRDHLYNLLHAQTDSPFQEKARDFFFFSFACNGMNLKDIALLTYEDYDRETVRFIRKKTIKTKKDHLEESVVYLTDSAKKIIQRYGNPNKKPKQYIFPIVNEDDTPKIQRLKIQAFTRFINQHLKKLALSIGITDDISTIWARHSWSTNAIRQGKSLEFAGEGLGHSDPKTTRGYFAGFEDETKREFAKTLMDF